MEPKKFNEYKIYESHYENGKFIIDHKKLTKRGHVSISQQDADLNNRAMENTRLYYELAEEKADLKRMNKAQLGEYIASKGYDIDMELTKANIIEEIKKIEE